MTAPAMTPEKRAREIVRRLYSALLGGGWLDEAIPDHIANVDAEFVATAIRAAVDEERETTVKLLADESYLRTLADYYVRGHKSYYDQLRERDGGLIDAMLALRSRSPTPAGKGKG